MILVSFSPVSIRPVYPKGKGIEPFFLVAQQLGCDNLLAKYLGGGADMSISFGSISTGLPKDIVQQIVKAEKIPLQKMNVDKGKIEERKTLVEDLSNRIQGARRKLSENATAKDLNEFVVDTDNEMVGVNIDKNLAQTGSYRIEVIKMAQKSSAMSLRLSRSEGQLHRGWFYPILPAGWRNEGTVRR